MSTQYTPADAWRAYEQENYRQAAEIWLSLLAAARDTLTHLSCQQGYALTLVAQKQFREAEAILQELFDMSGDGRYLHLLGQIALDCDRLDRAKTHFLAEQACLPLSDSLNRSLNANALAWIALKQGNLDAAVQYARLSLDYAGKSRYAPALSAAYQMLADVLSAGQQRALAAEYYEASQLALGAAESQPGPPSFFEQSITELLVSFPELRAGLVTEVRPPKYSPK